MASEPMMRSGRAFGDMTMMAEGLKRSSESMDVTRSPIYQEVMAALAEERTVLDIGAGVGRFTGPLAKAECRVTAIEPSEEMLSHLNDALRQQGVADRVTVIQAAWPLQDSLRAEVALAAFVIQFSEDVAGFAQAMERAAIRRCILAVHVDPLMGFLAPLWSLFRSHESPPHMPAFADIYPQLLNAGIMADVRIFSEPFGPRWSDPKEALPMLARRLRIEGDAEATERLNRILQERREEFMQPRNHRVALLSWAPREK